MNDGQAVVRTARLFLFLWRYTFQVRQNVELSRWGITDQRSGLNGPNVVPILISSQRVSNHRANSDRGRIYMTSLERPQVLDYYRPPSVYDNRHSSALSVYIYRQPRRLRAVGMNEMKSAVVDQ